MSKIVQSRPKAESSIHHLDQRQKDEEAGWGQGQLYRISQIRWADHIVVLRKGEIVDQGTHAELMERCDLYRRIFAHYDGLNDAALLQSAQRPAS